MMANLAHVCQTCREDPFAMLLGTLIEQEGRLVPSLYGHHLLYEIAALKRVYILCIGWESNMRQDIHLWIKIYGFYFMNHIRSSCEGRIGESSDFSFTERTERTGIVKIV